MLLPGGGDPGVDVEAAGGILTRPLGRPGGAGKMLQGTNIQEARREPHLGDAEYPVL